VAEAALPAPAAAFAPDAALPEAGIVCSASAGASFNDAAPSVESSASLLSVGAAGRAPGSIGFVGSGGTVGK
jgi:hypothetical protein